MTERSEKSRDDVLKKIASNEAEAAQEHDSEAARSAM
jgi:hypothetical protein